MATTPPESRSGDPSEEARVEEELQAVREQVLQQFESGDDLTWREYVGAAVGGTLGPLGLICLLAGLTTSDELDTAVLLVVSGTLGLVAAGFGLRGLVQRRVRMVRAVRVLRRQERALLAQLPSGSRRPGVLHQYYTRRFGSVWLAAFLFVSGLAITLAAAFGD